MKSEELQKKVNKHLSKIMELLVDNLVGDSYVLDQAHKDLNSLALTIRFTEDSDMRAISQSLERLPIDDLDLSVKARVLLQSADINVKTLGELLSFIKSNKYPTNLPVKVGQEIRDVLIRYKLWEDL